MKVKCLHDSLCQLTMITFFFPVYNISEMKQLLAKAEEYLHEHSNRPPMQCQYLYRNKPDEYFIHIDNCGGIMEAYLKDNNGDQSNPINGELYGLFFNASMDKYTGNLPLSSIYGRIRFHVLPTVFLNDFHQLYFSDFYCYNSFHYVLVVITRKNTKSDIFCQNHLVKLDKHNNPFLFISDNGVVMVNCQIFVEVFWADNVDMRGIINLGCGFISTTECTGHSRLQGLKKNTTCTKCNI